LAQTCPNTQQAAYLELAIALVTEDSNKALELARRITEWEDDIDEYSLDAATVVAALRAGRGYKGARDEAAD
jgi:nucleotidyltransferase/DNA polymerase involved in DNA repair